RMRLLAAQRTRPEDLGRLRLRSGSGELVPLTALVREEERPALQAIFRQDRERAIRSGVGSRCVHVAILFFAAMMKAGPIRLRPGAAGRADEHLRAVMPRCSGTGGAQYQ
ncbi:MAG TPA: hypothetical protein VJB15_08045, partial [Rhodothermia bacterium]|nr:hypothetical protein [Rhodothermia bacterium]